MNSPTSRGVEAVWEAANESEMSNALNVLYEMAAGYVLAELREEHPEQYVKLMSKARYRSQFTNNVRYSVDAMLNELVGERMEEPPNI